MKYLIKSSFVLILLMAVFNIGVTNAFAEEAKASETSKIEKVEAVTLQCGVQKMETVVATLDLGSQSNFSQIVSLLAECEPKTFRSGNYVIVVQSDFKVYRHKIDPHSGSETFDKA